MEQIVITKDTKPHGATHFEFRFQPTRGAQSRFILDVWPIFRCLISADVVQYLVIIITFKQTEIAPVCLLFPAKGWTLKQAEVNQMAPVCAGVIPYAYNDGKYLMVQMM